MVTLSIESYHESYPSIFLKSTDSNLFFFYLLIDVPILLNGLLDPLFYCSYWYIFVRLVLYQSIHQCPPRFPPFHPFYFRYNLSLVSDIVVILHASDQGFQLSIYGGFLKWGVPQSLDGFMEIPKFIFMDDRAIALWLRKPPYGYVWKWGIPPIKAIYIVGRMITKTIGCRGTLFSDTLISPLSF